jgi:hypothetical protein
VLPIEREASITSPARSSSPPLRSCLTRLGK